MHENRRSHGNAALQPANELPPSRRDGDLQLLKIRNKTMVAGVDSADRGQIEAASAAVRSQRG
jgi:hypothetical protein